ncbi:MAG TPA: replicative DNA helicase [Blastocatellia bacterium]|nr:replicative DNA helicase [Blastocatellia bacterium]
MTRPASGDPFFDKGLPSNIEAERSILGAILLDNTVCNQAIELLRRDDFFLDSHRRIFDKMVALSERGSVIDLITLSDELRRAAEFEQIGGATYIASLIDGVPRTDTIEPYAKIVKTKAQLRKLITASNQIIASCFDEEDDPDIIIDRAEQMIFQIAEDRVRQGFQYIGEVAQRRLEQIEQMAGRPEMITGVPTGFTDFDQMTSGLQRQDLIIIAARPSVGKCLAFDSEILLENGELATIEEIYNRRCATLLTLKGDLKLGFIEPSAFVDDGVKPVYRVTTRLGRRVESTIIHPFLTLSGWQKLAELKPGDKIAVPRRLEVFGTQEIRECEVKLLAYLIGDGCLTKGIPEFTNSNPLLQEDFTQAVKEFGGLRIRVEDSNGARTTTLCVSSDLNSVGVERQAFAGRLQNLIHSRFGAARKFAHALEVTPSLICFRTQGMCAPSREKFNQLCEALQVDPSELAPRGHAASSKNSRNALTLWLEKHELWGKGARDKTIPQIVFKLTRPQVALFLNRLFATDGWASLTQGYKPQLGYATTSERLARQIQHLLLRFGIIASLRKRSVKYKDARRTSWQLDIADARSIRTFIAEIGIFGKEESLRRISEALGEKQYKANRDLIPVEIWRQIAEAKGDEPWATLARRAGIKGYTNIHVGARALTRQRLSTLAAALGDESLQEPATSDIYWDEIVSIEPAGLKQVYDLTIPETHNFIANDICVHNTAIALNMAQYAAKNGNTIGIFSLEMSAEQLVSRFLCSEARVDAHRLRTGYLNREEWARLADALRRLCEIKVFIDDTPGVGVLEMRAKCRRLKAEHGLDLLIIDYLQLMSGRGRIESRQQEVSQISRELKGLAKELDVPVIALSQLSRAPETRSDHRPQLSDLRESGSIEQDSDVVCFIYREEVYNPTDENRGTAELIIGKQRNGPTGTVQLAFLKEFTRFENMWKE